MNVEYNSFQSLSSNALQWTRQEPEFSLLPIHSCFMHFYYILLAFPHTWTHSDHWSVPRGKIYFSLSCISSELNATVVWLMPLYRRLKANFYLMTSSHGLLVPDKSHHLLIPISWLQSCWVTFWITGCTGMLTDVLSVPHLWRGCESQKRNI